MAGLTSPATKTLGSNGLKPLFASLPEPVLKPAFSFHSSCPAYNLSCNPPSSPLFLANHFFQQAMSTLPDHQSRTPSTASRKSAKRHALLTLLLALTGAAPLAIWPTASDAGDNDHEMARQALRQGQVLPLRTVLDRVEQQYQGQVIKVEFERDDGRFVYEIRLLQSDGKVVKLEIDAGDGSLISMKRKK